MHKRVAVWLTNVAHELTIRRSSYSHSKQNMTWLDINLSKVKPLKLKKLKLCLLLLCAVSIGFILFIELKSASLYINFEHLVRATHFATINLFASSTERLQVCEYNRNASIKDYTLNMTTPEWRELMQGYIPMNLTQHKSLLIKLKQIQNGWDNLDTLKDNETASVQNQTEPLLALVNRSLAFWSPVDCDPVVSTAIIIPYRNREEHLRVLLHNLPSFLIRQKVQFTIFIVEQMASTRFNRALLMNIGFRESSRVSHFDCFIFHDVDLLPEDPRVPYACGPQPVHLSAAIDKFHYRLPYGAISGGVLALSRKQFKTVGGYSNMFFGWGGEDDDMYNRIVQNKYKLTRPKFVRYKMIQHQGDKLNERNDLNVRILKSAKYNPFENDGYVYSEYHVLTAESRYNGLVYWIEVDVPESKIKAQLMKRLTRNRKQSTSK